MTKSQFIKKAKKHIHEWILKKSYTNSFVGSTTSPEEDRAALLLIEAVKFLQKKV